jgi:hypothetical protein
MYNNFKTEGGSKEDDYGVWIDFKKIVGQKLNKIKTSTPSQNQDQNSSSKNKND